MRKTVSFALIALVIIMTTFSSPAAAQDNQARPDLRGPEAVEKLKETGQYESLMEAVKAARKENGQPTGEPNDLAVGQTTKLTASDGAVNDFFGWSVAVSGDTAIVGAYADDVGANSNQGSAYVFTRSGTTWSQQAQLTAADGAPGDQFGYSVAISGDTVVVGASGDTVGANPAQGSAYVFTRSGAAWTQQQKLLAADGAAFDQFGGSVAISGDTVLIGASRDTIGASSNQGSAYIFVRSGAAWSQQAQLLASDGAANDQFGESVGISGDTAIVGAFAHTVGANAAQGSAYVFTRSGAAWTQQAQLTAADGAGNDQFGWSVAISGDTAVVGAYVGTVGANAVQGSAYVFVRSGAAWSQQQKLTAADGAAGDQFGWSVAISGNIIIVGARFDDVGFNNDQGSTYVFVRSGAVWSQQQKLTVADGAAGDQFGYGVAISGSNMIVGAYLNNV
ncbi:MAG: FG-GAP repeat protein, partial [Acidobacteria bacterium]|nr:FG-GAP repeat protein [Acidobacteriota bacterium]